MFALADSAGLALSGRLVVTGAETDPRSKATVTKQLFECRSIPLYFILVSCRLKLVCKLTLTHPP
jgi:hypothetical protein